MNHEFKPSIVSRPVWGRMHAKLNKIFKNDRAFFRAPCSMPGCNMPHERKCDYVIRVYLQNGVRMVDRCNRPLCRGCAQTYSQVDHMNTIDFCPEHDSAMLNSIHNSK